MSGNRIHLETATATPRKRSATRTSRTHLAAQHATMTRARLRKNGLDHSVHLVAGYLLPELRIASTDGMWQVVIDNESAEASLRWCPGESDPRTESPAGQVVAVLHSTVAHPSEFADELVDAITAGIRELRAGNTLVSPWGDVAIGACA